VVGEREMRRAVAERLAHRDPLGVERVGDAPDGGLGALLVDVPAREMLDRTGIHDDQRGVDDRPGIHQGARERIAARLDDARERARDHGQRLGRPVLREDAGRQPFGPHRDGDLGGPVLADEPGQGAGLGEADAAMRAGPVRRVREDHRPECRRRTEDDLARNETRRQHGRDVALGEGRGGANDQRGAVDGLRHVGRRERQARLVPAGMVTDGDGRSALAERIDGGGVPAPEPDLVAGQREIARRRVGAVAAAENRDPQGLSSGRGASRRRKC
jgi:hypothetical protein